MRFKVEVYREWTERGSASVDAESEDEAREAAEEMLNDSSDEIEWEGSNMDPGNQGVESVTEAD